MADSARADAKRFPKHENSQTCSGCSLWQPTPTDALGNCTLFPG
ncbi:high-potential iron-sulfur protein [Variovorax sp. Root434]|nr:high-potential iron-sulfur protein [Variovorax sp. Root434]